MVLARLALVGLLAAAGCTQGSDTATASTADLQRSADALCDVAYLAASDQIPSGGRTDGSGGPGASATELQELAQQEGLLSFGAGRLAVAVRGLDGPAEDRVALAEAAAALDAIAAQLERSAKAASEGRRPEHDRAQRAAYEAYGKATLSYIEHFGRRCGTIGD